MTPLSSRLKAALAFEPTVITDLEDGRKYRVKVLDTGAERYAARLQPLHEALIELVRAAEVGCSCSYAIHTDGSGFQTRKPLRDGCALHAALAELRESVGGDER